jgi:Rho GDP-dissociation inhibitor
MLGSYGPQAQAYEKIVRDIVFFPAANHRPNRCLLVPKAGGLRVVSIHLVPVSRGLFARTSQQLLFSTVADPQFASEESPSGMLARSGSYVVRSRVIDDDAHVWLDFEWGESGSVALTPCVTRRPVWFAARSLERTS